MTAPAGATGVLRGYRWTLNYPVCNASGVLAPDITGAGICTGCGAPRLDPLLQRVIDAADREDSVARAVREVAPGRRRVSA